MSMETNGWRVTLLGGLAARRDGDAGPARFETRKTAALFALLALTPGRAHPREVLAERLWPDEDADAIRDRFRHALASLRRALEPPPVPPGSVVLADRTDVRLNPAYVTSDVAAFDAALEAARKALEPADRLASLHGAVELYQGELLHGFYEEWVFPERERLADAYQGALSRLAALLSDAGDLEGAVAYARRAVVADPYREEAHRMLMRLFAAAGRRSDVARQYRELERVLREDGLTPADETEQLLAYLQTCPPAEALRGASGAHTAPAVPAAIPTTARNTLEPDGGAVPLNSPFYIARATDAAFAEAVDRGDSIVLVKGPRQVGKTSLLARGLQRARAQSRRVVRTDCQKLTAEQFETAERLFFAFAEMLAEQLDLSRDIESVWNPRRGWNVNFERCLRRDVLGDAAALPLVWALDEVDRLFGLRFSSEVFGLFRSWHNERALDPGGPWGKLTLAIAYATEAHLFIADLNQSPFNVGTRLTLQDFNPTEVGELNRRYGTPLRRDEDVRRFLALVGGHPYLVRRGMSALTAQEIDLAALESEAMQEDGIYGDHLRRMLLALRQDGTLTEAARSLLLQTREPLPVDSFYRLRSAGIVAGAAAQEARFRCDLYRRYLEIHLT
jgi:DNA-binding SARP family transcriptional activator